MKTQKKPLAIFVLWHPAFHEGQDYANIIFTEFKRNVKEPLSRGMNIPVFFRYINPLLNIPSDDFEFTVVIALIDNDFIIDDHYRNFLIQLDQRSNKKLLIVPVAIDNTAFKIPLGNKNFARLYETDNKREFIIEKVAHETARHLYGLEVVSSNSAPPPPLKLFISHAKVDGLAVASRIKEHVEKTTALKTFFDANDIAIGYDFSDEIERHIQDAVLIAVHSDQYANREWCRREILLAKQHNRPIVVLNCFQHGESRSFPYMANVLTVHYQDLDTDPCKNSTVWSKLITAVLKETLRLRYLQLWIAYVASIKGKIVHQGSISAYPPELITVLKKKKDLLGKFIYPDPPLGSEEIELLKELDSTVEFITPTDL